MRLTERIIDKYGEENIFTKYIPDNQKLKDKKLCQLEDLEESTNIPFAKISSLKVGDIVYFKMGKISEGKVSNINYEDLTLTVLDKEGTFIDFMLFHQYSKNRNTPLHCWSGAWALTREELENEKNY